MAKIESSVETEPRFTIYLNGLTLTEVVTLKNRLDEIDDEECDCDGPCGHDVVNDLRLHLKDIVSRQTASAVAAARMRRG